MQAVEKMYDRIVELSKILQYDENAVACIWEINNGIKKPQFNGWALYSMDRLFISIDIRVSFYYNNVKYCLVIMKNDNLPYTSTIAIVEPDGNLMRIPEPSLYSKLEYGIYQTIYHACELYPNYKCTGLPIIDAEIIIQMNIFQRIWAYIKNLL